MSKSGSAILFRKVMEDINNQKFRCQFCEQEFDQNTLEVHNATVHNFQKKKGQTSM